MVNRMSRSLVKGRADENFLKPHTKLYLEVAPPWDSDLVQDFVTIRGIQKLRKQFPDSFDELY